MMITRGFDSLYKNLLLFQVMQDGAPIVREEHSSLAGHLRLPRQEAVEGKQLSGESGW